MNNICLKPICESYQYYLMDSDLLKFQFTNGYNAIIKSAYEKNKNVLLQINRKQNNWKLSLTDKQIQSAKDFIELKQYQISNNISTMEPKEIQSHDDIVTFIHTSFRLKPQDLFIKETKWKYLIRSIVAGKNILLQGHSGCGKTKTAFTAASVFANHNFQYFNLGSTQDPRSVLIGNTHFNKEHGTFFDQSLFVKAIQTPNSIILLDELSRANPEAWNILMTVLDYEQRYLRLDEEVGSPTIKVADGVSFIATANVGNEYTSTRVMDRALVDRFTCIEMDLLDEIQEYELLCLKYQHVSKTLLKSVSEIAKF